LIDVVTHQLVGGRVSEYREYDELAPGKATGDIGDPMAVCS
jgi:hypothetical protein